MRKLSFLRQCKKMMERALEISPMSSEVNTELAFICFLMGTLNWVLIIGNFDTSGTFFQTASTLDPHNVKALEGYIKLQIFSGQIEAAEEQLNIFNELQRSMGASAEIAYLNALLFWKKSQDSTSSLGYLNEALQIQLNKVSLLPLRYEHKNL